MNMNLREQAMSFDDFKAIIGERIKDYLPQEFKDVEVRIEDIKKNNTSYTAIIIPSTTSQVSPCIYLETFYNKYLEGTEMDQVLQEIADLRVGLEKEGCRFDLSLVMDYQKAKHLVVPRLIGIANNTELLAKCPHKTMADLAITYYVSLETNHEVACTLVTNGILDEWGVSVDELHKVAKGNIKSIVKPTFESMDKVLIEIIMKEMKFTEKEAREFIGEEKLQDNFMFVISNESKTNGAVALLDDEFMKQVIKKVGQDFYILPSSIHEVLIVPRTADTCAQDLEQMVKEINETNVADQDKLSDSVYSYNQKKHQVLRFPN